MLVRSTIFCFFCLKSGAEGASFRSALEPLSKRGNFRRLSARFNYSSSYGTENKIGDSIYFTEAEKYGKTTVTFKEHSSRKQTLTSHDQSQFTKLCRKTNPTNGTKQKIPSQRKLSD